MVAILVVFIVLFAAFVVGFGSVGLAAFWEDYGHVKADSCEKHGRRYSVGEMVQDILFHDPQKRGRNILLCTASMSIPCIVILVLLGRRVLCG